MNDLAGDGTSTAIILARAMIKSGLLAVAFGANPISLKKGMEKTVKELVKFLKNRSVPVKGRDHIKGLCFCLFEFRQSNWFSSQQSIEDISSPIFQL